MIEKELKKIVSQNSRKPARKLYLRNLLKEYLQAYILFYIYTADKYRESLIFTGGTCLRHFYSLPRLSEDLDFDYLKKLDSEKLAKDLSAFFQKKYQYQQLKTTVKQKGEQVLLKFPVLRKLNLAGPSESSLLYVKLDLSKNQSSNFNTIVSSKSLYDFNFIAKHYDLPNLMAGKLNAIFQRVIRKGKKDRLTIKGRDYFDLLWYLKKGIKPNLKRLKDLLNMPSLTLEKLENMLDKKVRKLEKKYLTDFKNDLLPLIKDPEFIDVYIENYIEEYKREKKNLFS